MFKIISILFILIYDKLKTDEVHLFLGCGYSYLLFYYSFLFTIALFISAISLGPWYIKPVYN